MSTKTELKSTNETLDALRSDEPRLEALLAKRDREYREAKSGGVDIDEVADLRARRDAVESMLAQHREEIAEVEAELAGLESVAEDERELAEVAAGSVAYREAERQWYAVMEAADASVRRAVTLSKYLSERANREFHRASSAAVRLAGKHGGDANEQLARGVVGADVEPLQRGNSNVPVWLSHDFGGRFRALAAIRNTAGLFSPDVDPEEELA